jgi:hypothetical protein
LSPAFSEPDQLPASDCTRFGCGACGFDTA